MDNSDIYFDDLCPSPNKSQPYKCTKPTDDLHSLPSSKNLVLYLAVITPHTDRYEIHGPAPSFAHLLPKIKDLCSDSPSALDKLEALQYTPADVWGERVENAKFADEGFTKFVVEGQRGTYTVLEILREENADVRGVLPASVYTVTRHGPLVYTYTGLGMKTKIGVAKGVAATSTLVGSFVERKEAQAAARTTMDSLVGKEKVSRIEHWGADEGGGVLLAMGVGERWEVRVQYEDDALRHAKEGADAEGANVGWRF